MKVESDFNQNFTFPNVEDVYDLETENLKIVKNKIEERIDVTEQIDNFDDSFCFQNFNSIAEFENSEFKTKRLRKLYKFVCSELKERNYFDEVLDFFMNKDSLEKITSSILNDEFDSTHPTEKFISLNSEAKENNENNINITRPEPEKNIWELYSLNELKRTQLNFFRKKEDSFLCSLKPTTHADIKSILQKTKLDDNFKLMVGQPTRVRNIRTAPPIKKQNNSIVPLKQTLNFVAKPKVKEAPIKISNNIILKINITQKKKIKKIREKVRDPSPVQLNNLELRKQYTVPDIKSFIRRNSDSNREINKEIVCLKNKEKEKFSDIVSHIETKKIEVEIKDLQYCEKNKNLKDKIVKKEEVKKFTKIDSNFIIETVNNINIQKLELKENNAVNESQDENNNHVLITENSHNILNTEGSLDLNHNDHNDHNDDNKYNDIFKIEGNQNNEDIKVNDEIKFITEPEVTLKREFSKSLHNFRKGTDKKVLNKTSINILENKNKISNDIENKEILILIPNNPRLLSFSTQSILESPDHNPLKIPKATYKEICFNNFNFNESIENPNKKNEGFTTEESSQESTQEKVQIINSKHSQEGYEDDVISEKEEDDESLDNLIITKQNSSKMASTTRTTRNKPSEIQTNNSDGASKMLTCTPSSKIHSTSTNFYKNENKNFNKDRKQSAIAKLKERSKSSKMPLMKHIQTKNNPVMKNIPDYSKVYKNFLQIFNGYFLSVDSNNKQFNAGDAMSKLYESIKSLFVYENTDTRQIERYEKLNSNIIKAEAEVIKNRLRQVSDKLLTDHENLIGERYYVFKKILELQKKEYGRKEIEESNTEGGEQISKMYFRVVLSRPEIYDIMCYTLGLREEWAELPHGMLLGQSWNLMWTYSAPNIDMSKIFSFQKVNHLINNRVLSRKDLLKKSLDRVRKMNQRLHKKFDIMPTTYILSKDYVEFVDEFTKIKNSGINPAHNLWIVKPVGKSRGRGIYVINDISQVPLAESFLVQKYLTNPLLVNGYKFDMRIYVLVTSVNPLEAFLYQDGFARVSNLPFSLNNNDRLVHLTNAAVQNKIAYNKRNQNYEKMYGGSKISLEMLKNKLLDKGINFDKEIWKQVREIILKSLVACQHDIPYSPSTFELFGYDIIIDRDLKCWLLEVNSSPSLDRSNVLDDQIKLQLVDDVLNLVDPVKFDRQALIEVLERRMNINNNTSDVYLYSPTVQLNMDLNKITRGKVPRAYGEDPLKMGHFEKLAPTEESERLIKMTGGQKMFGNKN